MTYLVTTLTQRFVVLGCSADVTNDQYPPLLMTVLTDFGFCCLFDLNEFGAVQLLTGHEFLAAQAIISVRNSSVSNGSVQITSDVCHII